MLSALGWNIVSMAQPSARLATAYCSGEAKPLATATRALCSSCRMASCSA
jgi:hypothetical protein